MFGVLVVVLRADHIAGLSLSLCQREIPLVVSLCALRPPGFGAGVVRHPPLLAISKWRRRFGTLLIHPCSWAICRAHSEVMAVEYVLCDRTESERAVGLRPRPCNFSALALMSEPNPKHNTLCTYRTGSSLRHFCDLRNGCLQFGMFSQVRDIRLCPSHPFRRFLRDFGLLCFLYHKRSYFRFIALGFLAFAFLDFLERSSSSF